MSQLIEVKVPDIGDYSDIPVIEICVAIGDTVKVDDALVTLESDKATMDVPSSVAGVVKEIRVALGDRISEGKIVAVIDAAAAGAAVDADNIYHRIFPETKIVEYRREVRPGDTLWTICGEIATDKEDLRKLVYQAKKDNRIRDVGNLQPGTLVIVRVEEARK